MKDPDLKTFRLLVAVHDLQSIARAAEQEHIEPSAVSKRILQMEADLGVTLFLRNRRGVKTTPAGNMVVEHARTLLFSMARIERDCAAFGGGVTGHVRVMASASAIAESLLDDVSAFMREPANRNIKVDIEERVSGSIVRTLRDGSAAVGVLWDRTDLSGLETRPYRGDQLALAVHADHRFAKRKSLRFEQTLDEEHVGLDPSTAVHILLRQAAAKAGRNLTYRAVVSNFDAALRVVAANLGVSVIPAEIVSPYAKAHRIAVVPLSDAWAARTFALCFRDHASLPAPVRQMVEYLTKVATESRHRKSPLKSPPPDALRHRCDAIDKT
ncbi:MAG: transcriptional regulator, LysR family [Rhizobacter sp.]|nr:transcriptional regulator, LysR family [Rhizobacter sp.]